MWKLLVKRRPEAGHPRWHVARLVIGPCMAVEDVPQGVGILVRISAQFVDYVAGLAARSDRVESHRRAPPRRARKSGRWFSLPPSAPLGTIWKTDAADVGNSKRPACVLPKAPLQIEAPGAGALARNASRALL